MSSILLCIDSMVVLVSIVLKDVNDESFCQPVPTAS